MPMGQQLVLLWIFCLLFPGCRGLQSSIVPSNQQRRSFARSDLKLGSYIPFSGLTGEADKEAISLEQTIIGKSSNDATSYIRLLDAWMEAFTQNPSNDQETKVLEYGVRMERILTKMEEEMNEIAIHAYATVIQMYTSLDPKGRPGDPMAAIRVLSRMENSLQEPDLLHLQSQRLLQYNRVLQGIASESPVLCSLIAVLSAN